MSHYENVPQLKASSHCDIYYRLQGETSDYLTIFYVPWVLTRTIRHHRTDTFSN